MSTSDGIVGVGALAVAFVILLILIGGAFGIVDSIFGDDEPTCAEIKAKDGPYARCPEDQGW